MRITDGKYYATNREGIQSMVDGKNEQIDELTSRLKMIALWADKSMDLHVPYVSGRIDVSISSAANRKANFLADLEKNLWCSECNTTWPCGKIDKLKSLRDFATGRGAADFPESVKKIAPKDRKGQFPEVCL